MGLNFCMGCMKPKSSPGPCSYCGFWEEDYVASSRHLPLGTILNGKYLVGQVLGESGSGITYVGCDLDLKQKMAIKEYYPGNLVVRESSCGNQIIMMTGGDEQIFREEKRKFLEKARSLAKFCGLPGIVAVKDFFQENGTAYIAMEFLEGQILEQLLVQRGGRMEPVQVFKLMDPVMTSLDRVHQSGLFHQNISPDNIMVSPDGKCKLIGFGAVRNYMDERDVLLLFSRYLPVEVYQRGNPGPWIDVYALCATMYRAVTGRRPDDVGSRVMKDELMPPSQLGVWMLDYQEAALMKGMAVFVQDRFQSVEELRRALMSPQNQLMESPRGFGQERQPESVFHPGVMSQPEAAGQPRFARQQEVFRQQSGVMEPTGKKPSKGMWLRLGAAVLLLMAVGIGAVSLITFSFLSVWSQKGDREDKTLSTSVASWPETDAAEGDKTEEEEPQEQTKEDTAPAITMGDVISVTATSSLSEYNMTHSPNRLMDGDLTTAWVEGANGQGQGESVTFVFRGDYQVSGFSINAGYQKSLDLYQKNSRPAVLRVSCPNGVSETYLLEDVFARQDVSLKEPVVTGQITFTIESVYEGGKYEDTVISELTLY